MFMVFSSCVRDHPSSSDARVEDTKWQKVVVVVSSPMHFIIPIR
jgi:hypothetical protein